MRQEHGDHHKAELDDEEPERHADHETRLARGAVDQGHDGDAVDDVEQVMQDGEEGDAAQYGEGAERLSDGGVDHGEPDPDARRDDEAQSGALAQRVVCTRHRRSPGYRERPWFSRSSVSTKLTRSAASNGFVTKRSAPRARACPPTSIAPALFTPDIATIFTAGHSRRRRPIVCSPPCPGMKMSTMTTSAACRSYARMPASPSAAWRTSWPACSRCFVSACRSVTSSSMMSTRAMSKEAPVGIEPTNRGFADLCLTTWLRRRGT